ncbi:MAG: NAD-dependent DNA ligase LigA [Christensenellales bacterium]
MKAIEQMQAYIKQIRAADKAYYNAGNPMLTDYEYDQVFDALKKLEEATGLVLSGSPTHKVSGEVLDELHKVPHTRPMLSADKTKSVDDVIKFIDGRPCVLSWKLDGSTMVLRYEDGELKQAITRGDGHAGDDVTHTARVFLDIPIKIKEREKIEVRGEAVISWANFKTINEELADGRYSHPRNLAAGSIGMLDAGESKHRCLEFRAFDLVEGPAFQTKAEQLRYMQQLGFHVVEHVLMENMEEEQIRRCMDDMDPKSYAYPVDGLIIEQNDVAYGKSLGHTGHHENRMIALKWKDEEYETRFRGVELRPTRKGRLSLTGLFDPVEMDGATVSRATLHNFDIFKRFQMGIGDRVLLIRSNMVIPQLVKNMDCSDTYELPETCPCCGADVVLRKEENTTFLYCSNPRCPGVLVQKFVHYCERTRMNIPGLSEATLTKFVDKGWLTTFGDLYELGRYKDQIIQENGFGSRSFERLQRAIDRSRKTTLNRFIAAMGIHEVGRTAGRAISEYFGGSWLAFEKAIQNKFDFTLLEDFGQTMNDSIYEWYADKQAEALWRPALQHITFTIQKKERQTMNGNSVFQGKKIVATGKLAGYTRTEIQDKILSLGATPQSAVSKTTDYLIVGEKAGSKLAKAQQLGVKVLTEEEFEQMAG